MLRNSQPSASNFSQPLEQFFLTVGQDNIQKYYFKNILFEENKCSKEICFHKNWGNKLSKILGTYLGIYYLLLPAIIFSQKNINILISKKEALCSLFGKK